MTKTSFRNMFRSSEITTVEIPIIQRDFAQGRQNPDVRRIRRSFLDVLKRALTGDEDISLDFVYGDTKAGRFIPLDGQQRLTSLYLLHWYLAVRCETSKTDREFIRNFTYHTRFSSRDFCAKLASVSPELNGSPISHWLQDQHWFAGSWKKDPTIQSMLVVIDDIQALFADVNDETCRVSWSRLTSETNPCLTFEILSLKDMGLTDELYIKMNSRGKPLTEFEHFKAQFEQALKEFEDAGPAGLGHRGRYQEFTRKIDQDWSDMIWPFRGSSDNADDKFLRLFQFLTDIIIWQHGLEVPSAEYDLETTARLVYGGTDAKTAILAQDYLFSVLDSFCKEFASTATMEGIDRWFEVFFTDGSHAPDRVSIFGETNLLADCCSSYGIMHGRNRAFGLPRTLLLYSLITYITAERRPSHADVTTRLRCLRNIIFASPNEIRVENFRALLREVSDYIANGDLALLRTFNRAQVEEEVTKASFIHSHGAKPELISAMRRLEDHDLLRGNLSMFEFDVDERVFIGRAEAFAVVFSENSSFTEVSPALLACGDYSQNLAGDRFQFGSPSLSSVWRDLFSNRSRLGVSRTKATLMKLLDQLKGVTVKTLDQSLRDVSDDYLRKAEADKKYDWRYYLTKYPVMRSGKSGIFISSSCSMGFDLCMMEQTRLSSYYSDPYIRAAIELSGRAIDQHFRVWLYGYDGYEFDKRWTGSEATGRPLIRTSEEGFKFRPSRKAVIQAIFDSHKVDVDGTFRVRQSHMDGALWDRKDRVAAGAKLLKDLVDAGE